MCGGKIWHNENKSWIHESNECHIEQDRQLHEWNQDLAANATTVIPRKFDSVTQWAVFHRQVEAAEVQNNWTPNKKIVWVLYKSKAADILHTVPAEAKYEDFVEAFRDRFGDHQLAASYRSQLKARAQASSESL